ncbi:MAG: nuclear transport factor 2 family protein [Anaerolineales bacterium]|nr:nuclear transport factor 2 family protein [Anaerolineales bacterium]
MLHPMMEATLARWHEMVTARDLSALPSLLADDVVFRSPFAYTPYVGSTKVSVLLNTVLQVFGDFTYHRQLMDGDSVGLEFSAKVGDLSLKGIDLIRFDATGKIVDFEVMIRPANALLALGQEMGKRLGEQGIQP